MKLYDSAELNHLEDFELKTVSKYIMILYRLLAWILLRKQFFET